MRDNFARPFIAAFPGNVHAIRNLAHARSLAAVEWSFKRAAGHLNFLVRGSDVRERAAVDGYDLAQRIIPAGRIYFTFATLMDQLRA